mgnify:CR=1 FL=1
MLNRIFKITLSSLFFVSGISVHGQELLKKEDAVKIAMENNFDIKIANSNLDIAKNNASIQNSNYLPSVTGTAGGRWR